MLNYVIKKIIGNVIGSLILFVAAYIFHDVFNGSIYTYIKISVAFFVLSTISDAIYGWISLRKEKKS